MIIGPAESLLPGATLAEYADMMLGIARRASVPVALHFDHGFTPALVEEAIDLGFTSVMYDGSMLPFDENARRVRALAEKAHAAGCSLEAEIGHVGSNGSAEAESEASMYTEPAEALAFARESGCDALAVAIGTAHGVYAKTPKLDLERRAPLRRMPLPARPARRQRPFSGGHSAPHRRRHLQGQHLYAHQPGRPRAPRTPTFPKTPARLN